MICPNPNCQAANPDNANFCRKCGANLNAPYTPPPTEKTKKCPKCKAPNPHYANVCLNCGTSFTASASTGKKKDNSSQTLIIVLGVIAALVIIAAVAMHMNKPSDGGYPGPTPPDTIVKVDTIIKRDTVRQKDGEHNDFEPINNNPAKPDNDYLPSNPENNGYAWLSSRSVTEDDLRRYTDDQVNLMINAIYARHGYRFKYAKYYNYFSQFSWYTPHTSDASAVSSTFSSIEKRNVNLMRTYLNKKNYRDPDIQ